VAKTNQAGALLSRTRYEPYGATAAGTNPTGIGFTGHVNDADTGLVYMKQRYYEPLAGRFLSVDPVTTDANTGGHFNRYVYANNNPYKFKDPDGRAPRVDDGLSDARIGGARAPDVFARDSGGRFVQYTPQEAIANLQATRAANGLTIESTLSGQAAKVVPNPYGKAGGPAHQGKVEEVAAGVRSRGLEASTEHRVLTPDGCLSCRFVDVVGKDVKGAVVEMHQVGRQTRAANPVAREVRALDDIQGATKTRPEFHPYN
jgi:RHS repeat-associated protein